MAPEPNLRVVVDGDSTRVYHQGDKVTGRVMLVLEAEEEIKSLRLNFNGSCITKTTRPFYVAGNEADSTQSRRQYEERIRLFNFDQDLVFGCTFTPKKYSWTFEFTFPDMTDPHYSRLTHGSKYLRDPHPLPPSFHARTNTSGGQAMVCYSVQARLVRGGIKGTKKTHQTLAYHPTPSNMPLEPKILSRVLYAQVWKPIKDTRTAIDKVFTKVRRSSTSTNPPRIVPTLHYPEKIAPGQHIPLLLSLQDTSNTRCDSQPQCILNSLNVGLTTYSTSMCGQPMTQPEDVVSKHVTCIDKVDVDEPLSFDSPTRLTNNFRLVDDEECIPSFKTYTITRRYTMTVTIGIKYEGHTFTITSTSALEILPRIPRDRLPQMSVEEEEVEPLPLYVPREPSKEFAPDYESLYTLSPAQSTSTSLVLAKDRSLSITSAQASGSSTPTSELGQPAYRLVTIQD